MIYSYIYINNIFYMKETLDDKAIDMLRDLPDMIPVFRQFYEKWNNIV